MYCFVWVSVPPELLEGPGEVEAIEGDEAVIRCRASGMPKPTFSFFKVLVAFVASIYILFRICLNRHNIMKTFIRSCEC